MRVSAPLHRGRESSVDMCEVYIYYKRTHQEPNEIFFYLKSYRKTNTNLRRADL